MASPLQAAFSAMIERKFGPEAVYDTERWHKLQEEWRELEYVWENEPDSLGWLKHELGDVYLCLLGLAQSLGLDLEKVGAERMKELGSQVYEYSSEKGWVKVGG